MNNSAWIIYFLVSHADAWIFMGQVCSLSCWNWPPYHLQRKNEGCAEPRNFLHILTAKQSKVNQSQNHHLSHPRKPRQVFLSIKFLLFLSCFFYFSLGSSSLCNFKSRTKHKLLHGSWCVIRSSILREETTHNH